MNNIKHSLLILVCSEKKKDMRGKIILKPSSSALRKGAVDWCILCIHLIILKLRTFSLPHPPTLKLSQIAIHLRIFKEQCNGKAKSTPGSKLIYTESWDDFQQVKRECSWYVQIKTNCSCWLISFAFRQSLGNLFAEFATGCDSGSAISKRAN